MAGDNSRQTPSQTVGPFFAYGLTAGQYGYRPARQIAGATLTDETGAATPVRITGQVFDGAGQPVNDAMIEIWQADATGRYAHPADSRGTNTGFRGFARAGTGADDSLTFTFDTIRPGSVDGQQAPHLNVVVFMRGLLNHCHTRVYFPEDADLQAQDPVMQAVPADRRRTLIATRQPDGAGAVYRFDIHMQGPDETVFFDI